MASRSRLSFDPQAVNSSAKVPLSLLVWVVVACALMWLASPPPEPPPPPSEELAASDRATQIRVRDAKAWQAQRGDLSLPWDQASGHLAIVIDDVGRELHVFDKLLSLRHRLSFAVLPGAVYAPGVQLRLRADSRRYREILLHLPMEPEDAAQMEFGLNAAETFLQTSDDASVLRRKLAAALERVPAAVGVNNHMGSRLTADGRAMKVVMASLAANHLFFVDSRTSADTLAEAEAREAGLAVAHRAVFLDNQVNEGAIEVALAAAAVRSRDEPVIAIGHPSVELYAVLRRRLPELHAAGIGVFPVSFMVRHAQRGPPSPD